MNNQWDELVRDREAGCWMRWSEAIESSDFADDSARYDACRAYGDRVLIDLGYAIAEAADFEMLPDCTTLKREARDLLGHHVALIGTMQIDPYHAETLVAVVRRSLGKLV